MGRKRPAPKVDDVLLEVLETVRRLAPRKRAKCPTLRDYAIDWFSAYAGRKKKPGTLYQRKYLLHWYVLPTLGKHRLDAIRQPQVQELRERCADLSSGTRNQILSVLNMILSQAEEDEIIDARPRIRLEAAIHAKKPVHETATYLRIVRCARRLGWRRHLAVLLGGDAGMRASECAALDWTAIDMKARLIHLTVQDYHGRLISLKNGHPRTIRMTRMLYNALARIPLRHRVGRVLIGSRGKPVKRGMISYWVDQAVAAAHAELPVGGAHIFRHCFASHMAEARAPITAIQAMGGWRHLSTMNPYLTATQKSLNDAVRLLDARRSRSTKK